jgi:hypothetical protein
VYWLFIMTNAIAHSVRALTSASSAPPPLLSPAPPPPRAQVFRVTKGAPHIVLELCHDKERIRQAVGRNVSAPRAAAPKMIAH